MTLGVVTVLLVQLKPFMHLKKVSFMLGLQTSPEKDCPPSTLMVFAGILFDTISMTLSIPEEKLNEL